LRFDQIVKAKVTLIDNDEKYITQIIEFYIFYTTLLSMQKRNIVFYNKITSIQKIHKLKTFQLLLSLLYIFHYYIFLPHTFSDKHTMRKSYLWKYVVE